MKGDRDVLEVNVVDQSIPSMPGVPMETNMSLQMPTGVDKSMLAPTQTGPKMNQSYMAGKPQQPEPKRGPSVMSKKIYKQGEELSTVKSKIEALDKMERDENRTNNGFI